MNKLYILLGCLFLSSYANADDTEIYGATAIDDDNRVKSNVLLIVDNSGSMSGNVTYYANSYDPDTEYSGIYSRSKFYLSTNASTSSGISISHLQTTSSSTDCSTTVNTLNTTGQALGVQYEWRKRNRAWAIHCTSSGGFSNLYSGNYLNYSKDPANRVVTDRMEVVKKIVTDLTYSLKGVNLGMMRFDKGDGGEYRHDGGMIDVPIADIETNAVAIRTEVAKYEHETNTPLSETLFEAQRYYSGGDVKFGNLSEPRSAAGSRTTSNVNRYDSPIKHECQKSHVIMLTDGDPTGDTSANAAIRELIKDIDLSNTNESLSKNCGKSGNSETNGGCMAELAYYMNNVDQSPNNNTGEQLVSTYTVGAFGGVNDTELLKKTAKVGGGLYYDAKTPDLLSAAINDIILKTLAVDATFTAPAVSVNAFSRSEHRNEFFYAVFKPNDKSNWSGNLKKFTRGTDGKLYGKSNSIPAIDSTTGYFSEKAQDHWSTMTSAEITAADGIADAKYVELGGAANLLNPASRTIYSEDGLTVNASGITLPKLLPPLDDIASATTLNVDADKVENLTKWIKGFDVNNTSDPTLPRNYMGDPLHSEPLVITYGGTDTNPDSTLFIGTNQGFIHAFNTENGTEKFAFIPKNLLQIQNSNYEDNTPAGNRPYGMDGPITSWMNDINNNSIIYDGSNLEQGEHIHIYAGMRRGGKGYYGLDVTDRDEPKLLFKIEGGVTDGFDKLGQTWSEMTVARVKFGTEQKVVLFFTGGYDSDQDNNDTKQDDDEGNAVYMVDARTGELLWTASNDDADLEIEEMKNSMPASISAVDISGDSNVDYLFAADTGGRVFRFDINQNNTGKSDFAKGGVIASLADANTTGNRRFYNKPNVAFVKDKEYGDYLTIAIGSGYRAHPLNETIEDRFYVIKDFNPYTAPANYITKEEAVTASNSPDKTKLYNATDLMIKGTSALTASMKKMMNNGGGWYVKMPNTGEKILAASTTAGGTVMFTTFSPSTGTRVACSGDTGQARFYALDQKTAMATMDLDGDGDIDADDSSKVLQQSGIPPKPFIYYPPKDPNNPSGEVDPNTPVVGTESINIGEDAKICSTNNCYVIPQYWRMNENVQ